MWIYGAFAGFFSRENHITWQVMETFSDEPNVAPLQLGYNTKLYVMWRCEFLALCFVVLILIVNICPLFCLILKPGVMLAAVSCEDHKKYN